MISSRQIKAARALLGWTQTELAKAAGLHLNAINKIENESGEPRSSTLARIQSVCESAGVRFRRQRGVELKEDVFEISRFEGPDYIQRLCDDVLLVLKGPQNEVLTCVVDERLFDDADRKQSERYYKQMQKRGFKERLTTSEDCRTFLNPDRTAYRWLPKKALGVVIYCIYSDRVAFINWQTHEVLFIRSKSLSDTFRSQFEFLWSQAKPFV
jgi:transcriptional regulator with XRE-family HTH domain